MTSPAPPSKDYNHRAFIAVAESYGKAAHVVAAGPRLPHPAPVGMLACHSMELALKAVLLANGAGEEDLKRHGHRLPELLDASGLDWSDLDRELVDFCADAMKEHAFRYIDMNRYFRLGEGAAVLELCDQIFHACLQVVMPGARRSLVSGS
ncbi:hypothetical protein IPV08_23940 [Methylobacterium sp. SD274]|uniref:hypothetical protein n=1 Tax=Methylobacterium sp. SD274 TaxID=2782009 RepID=UPI001A9650D9|nr:hypothetical protein [Methylobacterium sp. SD274]MBO1023011.1 hypothetical protein [Methylobacterium sp. SD274]